MIKVKETQMELQLTTANREELKKAEAELKKWLGLEEDF